MRISLLEKREDFISILRATLNETQYFPKKDSQKTEFFINKYLNFIATKTLPQKTFRILIKEYSNTLIWWRRFIQKAFVYLAISRKFRKIFSHNILYLPKIYKDFLIVGGNHRIRLFPKDLTYSLILLKKGENSKFCINDARLRTTLNLNHCPKVLDYSNSWIKEEYFEGTPLNRILDMGVRENIKNKAISKHWDNVIEPTIYETSIKEYEHLVLSEIDNILRINRLNIEMELNELILKTFHVAFLNVKLNKIILSSSHGDLQLSNILVKENEIKIIDWEHSDNRFYLFDHFILYSNNRSMNDIEKAISIYKTKKTNAPNGINITNDELHLNIIEELRFSMNEDFSLNFKKCGVKTEQLCIQINRYFDA